jgi:cytochrome P450
MDPPRHTHLRRTMRASFMRRSVEAERPFVRDNAHRLLSKLARKQAAELVSEFTDVLPNLVTLHIMGFPMEDAPQVVTWARELLHSDWPALNRTERGEGLHGAFPEFSHYLDSLVESRRRPDAPDDMITRLARCEVEGETPSATVLRTLTAQIILGGISTSTNMLGSLLYRLLADPSLHRHLREDPASIPAALEESLRVDPPVLFVLRNCTRETEIGGFSIRGGERVVVGISSANRDESIFEDPERYRLDRGRPRHLAFAGGTHLCIGAGLARVVGCETIETFTRLFDVGDVQLAPDFHFEGVPVFLEWGPAHLEVEFA